MKIQVRGPEDGIVLSIFEHDGSVGSSTLAPTHAAVLIQLGLEDPRDPEPEDAPWATLGELEVDDSVSFFCDGSELDVDAALAGLSDGIARALEQAVEPHQRAAGTGGSMSGDGPGDEPEYPD